MFVNDYDAGWRKRKWIPIPQHIDRVDIDTYKFDTLRQVVSH